MSDSKSQLVLVTVTLRWLCPDLRPEWSCRRCLVPGSRPSFWSEVLSNGAVTRGSFCGEILEWASHFPGLTGLPGPGRRSCSSGPTPSRSRRSKLCIKVCELNYFYHFRRSGVNWSTTKWSTNRKWEVEMKQAWASFLARNKQASGSSWNFLLVISKKLRLKGYCGRLGLIRAQSSSSSLAQKMGSSHL